MVLIYGIPNCGSVKKALAWAEANGVEHAFVDFRKNPIERSVLEGWAKTVGLEKLVNKRGTTWRKFPQAKRDALEADDVEMISELLRTPALIKRPVMVYPSGAITVGVIESNLQ